MRMGDAVLLEIISPRRTERRLGENKARLLVSAFSVFNVLNRDVMNSAVMSEVVVHPAEDAYSTKSSSELRGT